jgi:hypothetical protein
MSTSPDDLTSVFKAFNQLLHRRRARGSLNKEDAIRYSFFHALVTTGLVDPADVFLETLHTGLAGRREVDLMVPRREGTPGLLIEFKYDTRLQGSGNLNRTKRAAAVLFDLYRLSTYEPEQPWRRLMVYVSESEMVGHFRSARNGLADFFDGPADSDIGALVQANTGKTFTASFGDTVPNTRTRIIFKADQEGGDGLWVRVFETTAALA